MSTQSHSREQNAQTPAWSTSAVPPWSTATRPLSDIRELTEPSLGELMAKDQPLFGKRIERNPSLTRKISTKARRSMDALEETQVLEDKRGRRSACLSRTPGSQEDRSSIYSIPGGNVPPRSSSQPRRKRSISRSQVPSALPPPPPRGKGYSIPNRGKSRSPVRNAVTRLDPVTSDTVRRLPSRTFNRSPQPRDILEYPSHRHHRISSDLQLAASLFVGGGSIEGSVRVVVDEAERIRHKKTLAIARISVDLVGVEEASGGRKSIFLNLATELLDIDNPPPRTMVDSENQISPIDPFWYLIPSVTVLPFLLSLPLDVGPPPFHSRHAKIRYVVCVTLLVRDTGRQYLVRTSQDVSILSVYDPEKALMSLPSPLTASDERTISRGSSFEIIKMTAGLHRQVWVSGTSIFTDIHVANNSRKAIKKLELQLERDILFYKHAAAATMEKSASQARIFDSNERSILSKASVKCGNNGWNGVPAHSTDTRTCDLDIPRGHATVKCGKFFEVRYFLNVVVYSSRTKLIAVQLPIVLIHMNSLDVIPNSVAQVAAAIEERRHTHHLSMRPGSSLDFRQPRSLHQQSPRIFRALSQPRMYSHVQPQSVPGRAFAAPRMASLERVRADAAEIDMLTATLDASPRKKYWQVQKQAQGLHNYHCQQQQQQRQQQQQQQQQQSRPPLLRTHTSFDSHRGMLFPRVYHNEIAQPKYHGHQHRQHQQRESRANTEHERQLQGQLQDNSEYRYDHKQQVNQDIQYQFEYQTPPSNRKARLVDRNEAENLARQLRHVRSSESYIQSSSRAEANKADNNHSFHEEDQHQRHQFPFTIVGTKCDTGTGTDAGNDVQGTLSRLGFRDAEVEQTVNLYPLAPVSSSKATSGQPRQDYKNKKQQQQQQQQYGDSNLGKSHAFTIRSSIGGSVLRRLEPNRVLGARRKRNTEHESEQRERERESDQEYQEEKHTRARDRIWDRTRERNRNGAKVLTSIGATKSNIGAPLLTTATLATAAPAPAPATSSSSSSSSPRRWWDGKRDRNGEKEGERARPWI